MNRKDIHEHLLRFLVEQKVIFLPRQTNRDNKLSDKDWFLYGPDYSCVSFWKGFDGDRKIPMVCLMFGNSFPLSLSLCISGRREELSIELLNEIATKTNTTKVRLNEWKKTIKSDIANIAGLLGAILDFLNGEKLVIDEIIQTQNHPKITLIPIEHFFKKIASINFYRESRVKLDFNSSDVVGERVNKRRVGVKLKSEEVEIRNILAKRIVIKKKHNTLQNKLYSELIKKDFHSYLIMEEDYIDLKFETDEEIEIYEVKPYLSVKRCIKESLGQLFSYNFNLQNPSNKKIKLIACGPKKASVSDLKYIDFLKSKLIIEFDYRWIAL